MMLPP